MKPPPKFKPAMICRECALLYGYRQKRMHQMADGKIATCEYCQTQNKLCLNVDDLIPAWVDK